MEKVRVEVQGGPLRCAYCHDAVASEDRAACAECLAVHHSECWREGGGSCASCRGERALVAEDAPAPEQDDADEGEPGAREDDESERDRVPSRARRGAAGPRSRLTSFKRVALSVYAALTLCIGLAFAFGGAVGLAEQQFPALIMFPIAAWFIYSAWKIMPD